MNKLAKILKENLTGEKEIFDFQESKFNGDVICFYHNDNDGFCSGAIVRKYFDENYKIRPKMVVCQYEDNTDFSIIKPEDIVIVCDFSFGLKNFKMISELVGEGKFVWIDHHETAIKEVEIDGKMKIRGIRKNSESGCELTWRFFYPDNKMPETVGLLGRFDVWDNTNKFAWEGTILPFQYAMCAENYDPNEDGMWVCWEEFLSPYYNVKPKIKEGLSIYKYLKNSNKRHIRDWGSVGELTIDGKKYSAIVVNGGVRGSNAFIGYYEPNKYDVMVVYTRGKTGNWVFSIYSETMNVGTLAQKLGGGGHEGSAGFRIDFDKLGGLLKIIGPVKN